MTGPAPAGPEQAGPGPLAGFTVAVTAARRRDELGGLLARRGARVVYAPAVALVPLADDTELLRATRACLADPPDVVVVTTGIGFRGWLAAADGWGLGEELLARLGRAELLTRGPKARGAVRAAGLAEQWSAPTECAEEVLDRLLAGGVTGRRVAVQLHGDPMPGFGAALAAAGAQVLPVPVYRRVGPADPLPLRRLVESVDDRLVDAVVFTSAPAAATLLEQAAAAGRAAGVLAALRGEVLAACVGPVTAGPLAAVGVDPVLPARARLGALVRAVVAELPRRRSLLVRAAGRPLEVRGHGLLWDGTFCPLPPGPSAVLRALAHEPGRVLSRRQLRAALPGGGPANEHAVEMAVARLRAALPVPGLVQTVVKRGYRLAVDR